MQLGLAVVQALGFASEMMLVCCEVVHVNKLFNAGTTNMTYNAK